MGETARWSALFLGILYGKQRFGCRSWSPQQPRGWLEQLRKRKSVFTRDRIAAMLPPVAVTPLVKTARWSALFLGILYGKQRFEYLKPLAEEDRKIEEIERLARVERERIAKEIEANSETILK
ncbi:hypothetical protein CRUP_036188 [Coryphaenoides rupestris]|nr:hypothetical protein CRUP_036188 [Coryphaenoides rupestris]